MDFCHLHNHTQYSLLDGFSDINKMMKKAAADGQKAVAITDHGNMFGAFEFVIAANNHGLKPLLGCEVYVVKDRTIQEFKGGAKDLRYHQLLIAKNAEGYRNLTKICSTGFTEGFYHNFPRVDHSVIKKYASGLIATTCCLGSEVQQTILLKGESAGEKIFLEWLDIFGEDYYIELQRHGLLNIDGTGISQEDINQILLRWSEKHNVKVIATNDSHYINEEDAKPHDILLCLQTNADLEDEKRFRFPNDQFFLKTKAQMGQAFMDVPFALDNTIEIMDKVEHLKLSKDVIYPIFQVPPGYTTEAEYLRHLTFIGAQHRYGTISEEVENRLNYELGIIESKQFPGYFLIVQDFIDAAKQMGVKVGPGRGSGAGSCVAYCTGITNIDPLKYNLLFERFLNPERKSNPDFDIDFDDDGRSKVIDYVVKKYGRNQVAQIITYGTMAARSAIRDVGRVLKLPLSEADKLTKMIPEKLGTTLKTAFEEVPELQALLKSDTLQGKTLKLASALEGSVRHRGIHAAGVIIAPGDITDYIPVCTSKDTDMLVTQFEGSTVESAGMLKMDFLGLKTLSVIKDAILNIEKRKEKGIDIENISLDDVPTFELFQRGDTVGIFQFESEGMAKYLRDLKPTNIEDLIAMNALYRPGPIDNIPSFIARKHGNEKIVYLHPQLEPILRDTYGIMVYQEQIMKIAQDLAGYSLGSADNLRRAMGKKDKVEMEKNQQIFVKGAIKKNIAEKTAIEIFELMQRFADYGFNRSHAAAYSLLAYQTAYLKAHFPAEFMAALMTHYMNDLKNISFFMAECNRLGIKTLLPDINESYLKFSVNASGQIRFALGAIKGLGEAATMALIEERDKNGPFSSIFNLTRRCNSRTVNKKSLESLAMAGAFDSFEGTHRAQYFSGELDAEPGGIEMAIRFGASIQNRQNSNQISLFEELGQEIEMPEPLLPRVEPWEYLEALHKEKEVTGIFISGHPLDQFKYEMDLVINCGLGEMENKPNMPLRMACIVASDLIRTTKSGSRYGQYMLEDYNSSYQLRLFSEDFAKFAGWFIKGNLLYIQGKYIDKAWKGTDAPNFDLKLTQVKLLEDLKNEITELMIEVQVRYLDQALITELEKLAKNFPGKIKVKFRIVGDGYDINLFSGNRMVRFDTMLLQNVQLLPGITVKFK